MANDDERRAHFIEQYRKQIIDAVSSNDEESITLLATIVTQSQFAQEQLRTKGYGWTGLDLLETVKLVGRPQRISE